MDIQELLQEWHVGVRIFHIAHSKGASYYSRMHTKLGIPVIVLAALVGTTVFATLESSTLLFIKIGVGLLSVTAAVLASLQTFLGYGERSERHKLAAFKYGALRRDIEVFIAKAPQDEAKLLSFVEEFKNGWNTADNEAPPIPQRFYDIAAKKVEQSMQAAAKRKSQIKPAQSLPEADASNTTGDLLC